MTYDQAGVVVEACEGITVALRLAQTRAFDSYFVEIPQEHPYRKAQREREAAEIAAMPYAVQPASKAA